MRFSFVLTAEDVRTEFVLCPVCGEVSDGTRLMLAEAAAKDDHMYATGAYGLCLLSEDGTETELTLEVDEEEETVSFTLDFTNSETPVQVIRLIPEV